MSEQTSQPAVQPAAQPASPVSGDARALMQFESEKKSMGIAYLLWFFLGGFGGHRFYAGKIGTAITQAVMSIAGVLLVVVKIGLLILAAVGLWVIVDAFLIPGWVRVHNTALAARLGAR